MPTLARFTLRALALAGLVGTASCAGTGTEPLSAGPPARLELSSGDAQQATVGTELPVALVVRVVDANGLPVRGQLVNFRVTAGGGTVFAGAAATNQDGEARERWTLGTVAADSQRLEARAVDGSTGAALVFGTFRATALVGARAAVVIVSGASQLGVAGQPLPLPPTVRVTDQHGNPVSGQAVTFSVTGGNGVVGTTTRVTAADGLASTTWTLGTALGANTLAVTVAGLPAVSFAATAGAAPPAALAATAGQDQAGTVAQALAVAPTVRVADQYGNPVGGAVVTFAVTAGGGSVSAATATADADGIASTSWTLGTSAGANALRAQIGAVSVPFTATARAGSPASLVALSLGSQAGQAGRAVASAPSVRVLDQFGNPVGGVAVSFVVIERAGAVGASTVTSAADGSAGTSWTLGTVVGVNVLEARVGALPPAAFSANAGPGDGRQFCDVRVSATVANGGYVNPFLRLGDEYCNTLTSVDAVITVTVESGGATLLDNTPFSSHGGSWNSASLRMQGPAGPQRLRFSAPGFTPAISPTIDLRP